MKPATTTLKVFTETLYPNVNDCFDLKITKSTTGCKAPGFFVELIGMLAKRLNWKTQFIKVTNATTEDIFRMIDNGTLDTASGFSVMPTYYDIKFKLSLPIYYSKARFIVAPAKSSLTGVFDFLTVYKNTTWIVVFSTFILITLLVYFYDCRLKVTKRTSFASYLWKLFQLQLSQQKSITQQNISGNFLILVFAIFQCSFAIRLYSSMIKTQAVGRVNINQFEPKDLLNVLREGKYSFLFHSPNRWWSQDIKTETKSPFYEIRNAIQNNPIRYVENFTSEEVDVDKFVLEMLNKGNWITIGSDEDIFAFEEMGYCTVNFDTSFPYQAKGLLFRKSFESLPQLNQAILEETINIRRLYNKYYVYGRQTKCFKVDYSPKALSLVPFSSVFVLFIAGLIIALVVFIVELILFKRRRV